MEHLPYGFTFFSDFRMIPGSYFKKEEIRMKKVLFFLSIIILPSSIQSGWLLEKTPAIISFGNSLCKFSRDALFTIMAAGAPYAKVKKKDIALIGLILTNEVINMATMLNLITSEQPNHALLYTNLVGSWYEWLLFSVHVDRKLRKGKLLDRKIVKELLLNCVRSGLTALPLLKSFKGEVV
jgi:hypothetical protein